MIWVSGDIAYPSIREVFIFLNGLVMTPARSHVAQPEQRATEGAPGAAAGAARWRESAAFSPAERLVLGAAEAVHDMAVTDELFGELEAELGRAGAMELIVVVSQKETVPADTELVLREGRTPGPA